MNVDFPYRVDARGRTATAGHADHVRHMVELVLFTSPGERVNRPDFGCDLLDMVFTGNSPELAAALETSARAALQRWLGDLLTVDSLTVTAEEATLLVHVTYVLTATRETRAVTVSAGTPS